MLLFLTTNMAAVTSRINQQLQHHLQENSCAHTRPQLLFSQLLRVLLEFSQPFPNKTEFFCSTIIKTTSCENVVFQSQTYRSLPTPSPLPPDY